MKIAVFKLDTFVVFFRHYTGVFFAVTLHHNKIECMVIIRTSEKNAESFSVFVINWSNLSTKASISHGLLFAKLST